MHLLWEKLVRPAMFRLDPERAHELGMTALRMGLAGKFGLSSASAERAFDSYGEIRRFGLTFKNPIGLAAGFDKNCTAVGEIARLGFASVEVGTVTLRPQPGNPKPRLFRLPEEKALINRLGFNNDGAEVVAERLKKIDIKGCVVGVNIGRNKDVPNEHAIENYVRTFDLLSPFADYVVVNVSSPNTPDLRSLQQSENMEKLLASLQEHNISKKPVLVKIAPDLTTPEIESIVDVCLRSGIAGVVATNTTISRPGIPVDVAEIIGAGGLSGKPLEKLSTEVISTIYRYSKGKLPIVGVGGVFTPDDAFDKIAAGASLIQAYTGFIYQGPSFAHEINNGLAKLLIEKGFGSLDEAVGSNVRT